MPAISRAPYLLAIIFLHVQWLFRPPPYIAHADLESETITIRNPSVWRGANLDGYTLTDRMQRHTYQFPDGFVLRARTSLTCESLAYVFFLLASTLPADQCPSVVYWVFYFDGLVG